MIYQTRGYIRDVLALRRSGVKNKDIATKLKLSEGYASYIWSTFKDRKEFSEEAEVPLLPPALADCEAAHRPALPPAKTVAPRLFTVPRHLL